MKTLKNSKIVLLFLLIGISVGCKKEDQIKSTITPTSVVYEDTTLNSYFCIDSTFFIGAYGGVRHDTYSVMASSSDLCYSIGGQDFYTNMIKSFTILWHGESNTGDSNKDTTIKIEFGCIYSDTNTEENYKKYLPLVRNYSTYYWGESFGQTLRNELICNVKWGDESHSHWRYRFFNSNYDIRTNSRISNKKLSDGKFHLILDIEPFEAEDFCQDYDYNVKGQPTATFKARIVLN